MNSKLILERLSLIESKLNISSFDHISFYNEWKKSLGTVDSFKAEEVTNVAPFIDHTLLKPDAPYSAFSKLANEAMEHSLKAICVSSGHVKRVRSLLPSTCNVLIASVIGFPAGDMSAASKAFETTEAAQSGAKEIDMVIQVGPLLEGDYSLVYNDIHTVVNAAIKEGAIVKVILEAGLLKTDSTSIHLIDGCLLSVLAGAHFVKTSTGFTYNGKKSARLEDIKIMRAVVRNHLGIKASGGVKTYEQALQFIAAGATRIGTSNGVALLAPSSSGPTVGVSPGGLSYGSTSLTAQQVQVLKAIKMVILDADGVLNDGLFYYGEKGEIMKSYATRDGMGLRRIRSTLGITVGIVTGEKTAFTPNRAKKLDIPNIAIGIKDKISIVEGWRTDSSVTGSSTAIPWSQILYMGDDINDIPIMKQVGFACTPSDGHPSVHPPSVANLKMAHKGGNGAVREVCDLLLLIQAGTLVPGSNTASFGNDTTQA